MARIPVQRALATFFTLGIVSLPTSTNAANYSITGLTLGGSYSEATGINASGQVVGNGYLPNGSSLQAFLYSGGATTDLGTLGGNTSMATAINASGQVVGTSALPNDSGSNTFLYSRGTMTDLSALGSQSAPTAINDSGQIVGYYNSGGLDQAFLYSGGTVADLNPLVGPSPSVGALGAEATGINDSRQILGYASPGEDANSYPFIYSGGSATMLGTLPGTSGLTYFSTGINSFGQAVGYAYRNGEPGTSHAFLYSQGAMIDIRPPSATVTDIEPNDINDSGQVVGEEDTDTTTNHAFLYSGGVMTDLNSLVVGSGWTLVDATGINDSGQIVGYGIDPSGNGEAFLLSPVSVPEPGGLVLLAFLG